MSAEQATGDCFLVANRIALDATANVTLCHGLVTRHTDGHRHWHAWVEVECVVDVPGFGPVRLDRVIDRANGNDMELPVGMYYNAGRIDAEQVRRYTPDQARVLMLRSGHFGPWEVTS